MSVFHPPLIQLWRLFLLFDAATLYAFSWVLIEESTELSRRLLCFLWDLCLSSFSSFFYYQHFSPWLWLVFLEFSLQLNDLKVVSIQCLSESEQGEAMACLFCLERICYLDSTRYRCRTNRHLFLTRCYNFQFFRIETYSCLHSEVILLYY